MEKEALRNSIEFLLFSYFGLSCEDGSDLDRVIDRAVKKAYRDATNQGAFNALFTTELFPDREKVDEIRNEVDGMNEYVAKMIKDYFNSIIEGKTVCWEIERLIPVWDGGLRLRAERSHIGNGTDYDSWHAAISEQLCEDYRTICYRKGMPKADKLFTYGNAQKWVNMAIKNLYVISGAYLAMGCEANTSFYECVIKHSDEYHAPLDNIILGSVYKQKLTTEEDDFFVVKYSKKDPNYQVSYIFRFSNGSDIVSFSWSNIKGWETYNAFRETLKERIEGPMFEWECRNWIDRKKQINALGDDLTTIDD